MLLYAYRFLMNPVFLRKGLSQVKQDSSYDDSWTGDNIIAFGLYFSHSVDLCWAAQVLLSRRPRLEVIKNFFMFN